jgi:hypothetical protein
MIEMKTPTLYAVRLDELLGHPMVAFLSPELYRKLKGGMVVTLGKNINDVGVAAYLDENDLYLVKLLKLQLYRLRGNKFIRVNTDG